MSLEFELPATLACQCTKCGAEVPGWEDLTRGAERALSERTADGVEYTVETARAGCPRCGSRRLRVRFSLGSQNQGDYTSECDERGSSAPPANKPGGFGEKR